jgi:antitoxin (DNA-binding transcriptional repressor) of toxin-antitoxin stability system
MSSKTKQSNIIGLKNLRENMETFIDRVQKGESLTVLRRNQPIFQITPIETTNESDWETVIDFTEINPKGVPANDLLKALQKAHG